MGRELPGNRPVVFSEERKFAIPVDEKPQDKKANEPTEDKTST